MGGPGSEREISLITGRAVFDNLNRKKYRATLIEMTRNSNFVISKRGKQRRLDFINADRKKFDLIFIALHGSPGEDGTVQGMFEALGVPYTGSGTLASALAMDKEKTADLYRARGLPTPDFIAFGSKEWKNERSIILREARGKIGFPMVIKPTNQGSAVGTSMPKNENELKKNIEQIIKKYPRLLIQKFINGREATCGVLEKKGAPFALPPTRIIANKGEFYDYASKYSPGGSTHICPADFSPGVNKRLQDMALAAHRALACRGMSRTDIFVADDEKFWVIETNTIPGMTPVSLLPEAAAKAGISFSEMLDLIISAAL